MLHCIAQISGKRICILMELTIFGYSSKISLPNISASYNKCGAGYSLLIFYSSKVIFLNDNLSTSSLPDICSAQYLLIGL